MKKFNEWCLLREQMLAPEAPAQEAPAEEAPAQEAPAGPTEMENLAAYRIPGGARLAVSKFLSLLGDSGEALNPLQKMAIMVSIMDALRVSPQIFQKHVAAVRKAQSTDAQSSQQKPAPSRTGGQHGPFGGLPFPKGTSAMDRLKKARSLKHMFSQAPEGE